MSTSRRHHYVPQFYLRAFTVSRPEDGEGLWVYDKHDPSRFRFQTPVNTAVKAHFYSFEAADGGRHDNVERLLAGVEGAATPIIARWREPGSRPDPSEVPGMAQFLAFMHTRVPRSLEAVREMEKTLGLEMLRDLAGRPDDLRANLERYKAETGADRLTLEEITEDIRQFDERFKLEVGDRHPLSVSLHVTPVVMQELMTMSWCICDAPSTAFFITGDCPLNIFVPVGDRAIFGGGLARREVQVTFPLSPTACLLLQRKGGALRRRVGEAFVHEINRRTAFAAERFVISTHATRRVAEWVRKGSVSVGRPKTDKDVLIPRMRARMAADRRTTAQPARSARAAPTSPHPSGP